MIKSYGKFKEFEIRDPVYLGEPPATRQMRYDVVKWYERDEKPYCYSLAFLTWNPHESDFDFKSVGMRYLEDGTEELGAWLAAWCKMKRLEILGERDDY